MSDSSKGVYVGGFESVGQGCASFGSQPQKLHELAKRAYPGYGIIEM